MARWRSRYHHNRGTTRRKRSENGKFTACLRLRQLRAIVRAKVSGEWSVSERLRVGYVGVGLMALTANAQPVPDRGPAGHVRLAQHALDLGANVVGVHVAVLDR